MIVRHRITCDTCGHAHTLRIQVGHERYQEHTFQCCGCQEQIVIGMNCDQENGSIEITERDNCKPGSREGSIINLSSEFPVRKEDLHRDLVFPVLEHVKAFIESAENKGLVFPTFSSPEDAHEWCLNNKTVNELWPTVKKGWSLTANGRHDLALKKFAEYRPEFDEPLDLQYILFDFCREILAPAKYALFEDAAQKFKHVAQTEAQRFQSFRNHYRKEMRKANLDRYFETFKEYFSCFTDFSQTLAHMQMDLPIPSDYEVTSSNFTKTKLFYGNAYETLTRNVTVLACINNIDNGRNYDTFQSMDLKKYLTINKANRCNPFKDTPEFRRIGLCLESTIRNASHHGSMKLINSGRSIEYQSGGTGARRTMSYINYINQCNNVMMSCCALLSLELLLAF